MYFNYGQDKWRNINVTAIWGSRQKAKLALKKSPQTPKRDDNSKALSVVLQSNEDIVDAKPLAVCNGTPRNGGSKELVARLHSFRSHDICTCCFIELGHLWWWQVVGVGKNVKLMDQISSNQKKGWMGGRGLVQEL